VLENGTGITWYLCHCSCIFFYHGVFFSHDGETITSQIEVLIVIKELGGRATKAQILEVIRKKFPGTYLSQNIGSRLSQMRANGTLTRDEKTKEWVVLDDSILRNRNVVS
jgi:hypothetical protein